ncbi:MAG: Do family serine endopeptidase [Bryobacteraceae bacterium]
MFTLAFGILIGTLINTGVKAEKGQAAPNATPLAIPNPVQLSTAFSQLAKQLEPSVVNVSTSFTQKAPQQSRRRPGPSDEPGGDEMNEFFQRFFGGNPFGNGPFPERGPRRGSGLGSGVIIDKNGYILTNNHVIEKADRIRVRVSGMKQEFDAKLIGADQETDLAVIKIESDRPFQPARIGNSDAVGVGDWAVAIGSPFGLQATVTAGIISAKERNLPGAEQFQHFLQTDAAINPGNSGGPLLNINGEVIGINTAIATQSGGYQGIGFALPVNTAAKVYNQIIKTGKMTRGSIGISFREAQPELLEVYGAKQGVFVVAVEPKGPAERAGLKPADIILSINGKQVKDGTDLVERVADTPVGQELKLAILRDERKQDVTITVGDRVEVFSDRFAAAGGPESEPGEATEARFGFGVENLSEARKSRMGISDRRGVLIFNVEPGSFAEDVGLAKGDVIVAINRQPVNSVDDVPRLQGSLKPGDPVAFHILRQLGPERPWQSQFLAGTVPNR